MEAVKNGFSSFRRNAGAFIVDADADLVADAGHGNLDETAGRREAHRIIDDRIDRTGQAVGLAHDGGAVFAWASEGQARVAGLTARLPAVDELFDQRSKIDTFEGG